MFGLIVAFVFIGLFFYILCDELLSEYEIRRLSRENKKCDIEKEKHINAVKEKNSTTTSMVDKLEKDCTTVSNYSKKELMTFTEKRFYKAIHSVLPDKYYLLPQINLASIVQKNGDHKYQNELFRNVDFGIFDENFHLVVLIEVNDSSHNRVDRIKRDIKVKSILKEAEIPLITFHTQYGVDTRYIQQRVSEYIK